MSTVANLAIAITANADQFKAGLAEAQQRIEGLAASTLASAEKMKALDKAATLAQLRGGVEAAKRALDGFSGAGGGAGLLKLKLGLQDAKAQLKAFETANRTVWDRMHYGASKAAGAFGAVNRGVVGTLNVMDRLPIVGKVFAATQWGDFGFMLGKITDGIKDIAGMQKQADKLGISINSLSAIQVLAGGSAEAMEKGLFRLAKTLGAVASGNEEAKKTIEKLGFTAGDFAGQSLDQSLALIADRFANLKDPAQKAYLAFELFGKTGFELIPALSKGSAGLAEAAEKAKAFGLALSGEEGHGVARAAKALRDIDLLVKGIHRRLAVEFAPIIGAIAEAFTKWQTSGKGVGETFKTVAEIVGKVLAAILDAVASVVEALEHASVRGTAIQAGAKTGGGLGALIGGIMAPDEAEAPRSQLRQVAEDLRDTMGNLGKWFADAAKGGKDLTEALPDESILKMAEDIGALKEELLGEIETFGQSADGLKRWKLAQKGATDAQLAEVDALRLQVDWLKHLKDAHEKAVKLYEDSRNPVDKFADQLRELNELANLGEISWETYALALAKAADELDKLDAKHDKGAGAFHYGSQEAFKAIFEGSRPDTGSDPAARLQAAVNQQIEIQKQQLWKAQQILDALREGAIVGVNI